jgi:hypothetical protein
MKTLYATLLLVFTALTLMSTTSMAWGRDWRGGPGYRYPARWNQGFWRHTYYQGHMGWWWVVGGSWYFYAAAPVYPYPQAQPVYVYPAP